MTPEQMLQQAAAIIAERGAAYGDAAASMSAVAARWSITFGQTVTPAQVVLCMIDLKLALRMIRSITIAQQMSSATPPCCRR